MSTSQIMNQVVKYNTLVYFKIFYKSGIREIILEEISTFQNISLEVNVDMLLEIIKYLLIKSDITDLISHLDFIGIFLNIWDRIFYMQKK